MEDWHQEMNTVKEFVAKARAYHGLMPLTDGERLQYGKEGRFYYLVN